MDYRQKMVVSPQQNIKPDDDDDEDLEALRLAALKSLRTKDATHNKRPPLPQMQKLVPQVTQPLRPPYKNPRLPRRGYYHNRLQQRQNGNLYYQSPRNPNLIAIVPVEEQPVPPQINITCPVQVEKTESKPESHPTEVSKFHRFKDHGSGSEDEDNKESNNSTRFALAKTIEEKCLTAEEPVTEKEDDVETVESPQPKEDDQENANDDDDDILLMADLEEEDSLERLMDEMEKEMSVDKPSEKGDKKSNKKENKESVKDSTSKVGEHKNKVEDGNSNSSRKENYSPLTSTLSKNERRSVSPHTATRSSQKRRSLSPRSRPRKKSPRRSPRRSPRSPIRQFKKSQKDLTRYRSPRKSPPRYSPRLRSPKLSPRPRSPRLSPRRSPNRSPIRRSPLRKLSPRGRSPKLSPHSRSPRTHRSRSPRITSRSRSPRLPRSPKQPLSRSPRPTRSRSPRFSPRISPQSRSPLRTKSPRLSPRRSPLRRSPKLRSPVLSPRRGSPRLKSPKGSPRRSPPRLRSPRGSPRRSPWSSPRNSPRMSPKRRRSSPKWSPKESTRKHGQRSITPEKSTSPLYIRESPPAHNSRVSPETNRGKTKQKEDTADKIMTTEKDTAEVFSDPVLEARRRKFESMRPIDPINVNKKIKLSKKENTTKKESIETSETVSTNVRKITTAVEEYKAQDTDLGLEPEYEFEEFDETMENTSPITITSSLTACLDVESQKPEKERSSKKKKKRDKELYQVGKLKNELPLSERIGKDKKCKKRKEPIPDGSGDDVETVFEDIAVDEEGDLRTELSRRRAERLNRTVPVQSARLVQSAFKGVVNEVVKSNAKVNQRHVIKADEKSNQKEVRRVTVLHRTVSDVHDSEDETTLDTKVPVRFRLGRNKQVQENRESKASRKTSKRQGRKVKHKSNLTLTDPEHIL